MREILIRGKRLEIGDWVIGSLIAYPDGDCYIARPSDNPNVLDKFCADPSTIGQYTGLKDKNGERIFEADILKFTAYGIRYIGVVEFVQGNFCIMCKHGCPFLDHAIDNHGAEKIGNIHDNPELLEGGEAQ